ncbi:MAG: hypothetical protein ACT4QD_26920 [Acidobacteriota bacterium]
MNGEIELQIWVWLWLAVAGYMLARHWRAGAGVGLVLTYVLSSVAIHWLAGAMYLLPWYTRGSLELTAVGLRESTIGLIALALGAEVSAIVMGPARPHHAEPGEASLVDGRVVNVFLWTGLIVYGLIAPIGARIPSVAAVLSTGSSVIVAALGLKCWNAWCRGHFAEIAWWLGASLAFPLVTVVSQGFLGFGFAAMLILFAFVANFTGPRKTLIIVGLASWYLGLSVYVTYMRDRTDIRDVVWTGASLENRVNRIVETFTDLEWFNAYDDRHLRHIDGRLNQNYLIGAAAANLEPGFVSFAYGTTISDAVLAVIPRAIWPDKPMVAGSGNLVTTFTGIRFPEGTSVGIGHIMESYVNFGTPGVAVGLFVIGAMLALADRKAARFLRRGDPRGFLLWYLPGLSLLLLGGSFIEMTSSAAAALLMAILMTRMSLYLKARRPHAAIVVPPTVSDEPAREVET